MGANDGEKERAIKTLEKLIERIKANEVSHVSFSIEYDIDSIPDENGFMMQRRKTGGEHIQLHYFDNRNLT